MPDTLENALKQPAHWLHPREDALPVLTVEQIREIERLAFASAPSYTLMEAAGRRSAQRIMDYLSHSELVNVSFLILAGPGNNGGDALVVAAELHKAGFPVEIVEVSKAASQSEDRAKARQLVLDCGLTPFAAQGYQPKGHLIAIDGLLGIGCTRKPEGEMATLIKAVNTHPGIQKVFALDTPSGLNADTGLSTGCAIQADVTFSFIACKPGLLCSDGKDLCGEVAIESLNCDSLIEKQENHAQASSDFQQTQRLPARSHAHHKGSFGSVGVIGGAHGMVGACLLAARTAISLGAGRVAYTLLGEMDTQLPNVQTRQNAPFVDTLFPELMNKPLSENLNFANTLAVGTGLGQSAEAEELMQEIIELSDRLPMVMDADALNLLAHNEDLKQQLSNQRATALPASLVLTPHPLEAARLIDKDTRWVLENRLKASQIISETFNCVVVLKGAGSLIVEQSRVELNTTGGPILATGGSGDVLTGAIAAMMAQGLEAFEAASCAVWLHGLSVDPLGHETFSPCVSTASSLIGRMQAHLNDRLHKRSRGNR